MERFPALSLLLISLAIAACTHEPTANRVPSREASLAAGAGGSHAPGSTGLGAGTQGPLADPSRVPLTQNAGSQIGTPPEVPLGTRTPIPHR